ncbi:bifunctional hydroxymethylpyrimidine kinase/phosphomethylpyrimidine kinase [Mesorhizobium sp. M0239]|uniref:bifunctional hydroxymethylpyrimidine kinase/phosphomethylpyrimidine kinase n=1 Tax=Mesorhizobium sp. M0239 TaxID=2956924 RepID=UPI003338263C
MALGREPHLLVVVGSDSRGGAGIAREIETIACLDVRTCLCCQRADGANPGRRLGIQVTQPGLVTGQMRVALQANRVAGTKVGMLATAEIIVAAVAGCAARISGAYRQSRSGAGFHVRPSAS